MIRLRDVETGDLPVFFEHQRDPAALAMVATRITRSRLDKRLRRDGRAPVVSFGDGRIAFEAYPPMADRFSLPGNERRNPVARCASRYLWFFFFFAS
jgi:hypothetical protein